VRGVARGDPGVLREVEALAAVEHEPAWVSGSCLMARRRTLDSVGLFDEDFFLYEEDVDLCVRAAAAGWRIVFTPAAEAVHHAGASMAGGEAGIEYHRSHLRFYERHHGRPLALALRGALAARGALGWLTARGTDRRRSAARLVRLALRGR
jgi:N-acetylglucosaminyl-diphospho-decaprenol L-rhamnosyltransferase